MLVLLIISARCLRHVETVALEELPNFLDISVNETLGNRLFVFHVQRRLHWKTLDSNIKLKVSWRVYVMSHNTGKSKCTCIFPIYRTNPTRFSLENTFYCKSGRRAEQGVERWYMLTATHRILYSFDISWSPQTETSHLHTSTSGETATFDISPRFVCTYAHEQVLVQICINALLVRYVHSLKKRVSQRS